MNAIDSIWDKLGAARAPRRPLRLQSADELANLPPLHWRVRGILPESGIAAVFGPSGSGKSFLMLDLGAAIAGKWDWFNAKTTPCKVVYVALEGEYGMAQRVQALRTWHGTTLDNLYFLTQPLSLLEQGDINELVQVIRTASADGGVLIIDTLNRAAPGADENSSVDMGHIIEATKHLQMALGGLVLLVHHSGKDSTKGLRGHSSLHAALDTAIEVSRNGDKRAWKVVKSKDGNDGDEQPFKLEIVDLGLDADGYEVTSCVVVPDTGANDVKKAKLPQGGNQKLVLDALRPLLCASSHLSKAGAPNSCPCIELEVAVRAGAAVMTCEARRRTTRVREAITGLVARGAMCCNGGWLWLAQ